MHLYEIGEAYRQFAATFEDTDDPTLKDQLKNIEGQFKDKALNIATLVVELEAETVAIKTEVDRLSNRERIAKNKIKWLKDYLLEQMLASSIDKIPGQLVDLSLRKTPVSVVIIDQSLISEEFIRTIPETKEPNKILLISKFKDTGEMQPGVEYITDKRTLQIK
jgi:hypothetical protein